MTDKLKPCPFCGNEYPTIVESNSGWVSIKCPECQTTFERDFYQTRGELGRKRLIEAWNRRVEDDE